MHANVSFPTAVVLAVWLSASVHAEQPAAVAVSDPVDLSAACGATTSEAGVHGGTQTRICRTSHGTYAAFLGKDAQDPAVIHLIRIRDGRPERLASIPTSISGANSVHVVCDAEQEVYVVAPGCDSADGKERAVLSAYHVDRATGATTEHRATVPFESGRSFGYGSAFLDAPGRAFYALFSGGDAPGHFAWVRFDLAEKRWAEKAVVADLAYRHCYNYGFADGRGGVAILSERDIKTETAGIAPTDPGRSSSGARYVWDELRLFKIPNLTQPAYEAVDVEKAVYDKQAGLYPSVQNNFGGDAYVDSRGRMHVLYRSNDNNRTKGGFNRHAVLAQDDRPRVVSNELLPFQEGSAIRMFQSTVGRLYIAAMPYNQPARVQVWGADDAEGLHYKLLVDKRLSKDVQPSYAGLVVSCPRNGSIQDDVVDCLFPSGRSYHHFRIRLK